jgi:hypothetical protein
MAQLRTERVQYPTIKDLGGTVKRLMRYVNPDDENWSATNPSIGYSPKHGYALMFRSSNYVITATGTYQVTVGKEIQSHAYFAELDDNLEMQNVRRIDVSGLKLDITRGLEDPKLIWRNNDWWFTAVMLEKTHTPVARMVLCKLDKKATKVVSIQKFPGIEMRRPEKNWMLPYEPSQYFDFVYGPTATVKNGLLSTVMSDSPATSAIRGNTNLHDLGDETYLAVVHRMVGQNYKVWDPTMFAYVEAYNRNYVHYFARYDKHGSLFTLSPGFQFIDRGVEFAAGLVEKDENFLVSFGRGDVNANIATLTRKSVMAMLKPVDQIMESTS